MTETIRLAKRLAQQLPCSRREAELYVQGGWVRVNGQVVEEPQHRVREADRVELDPQARPEPLPPPTLLVHQPPGLADTQAAAQLGPATRAAEDTQPVRVLKSHFSKLTPSLPLEPGAAGLTVWSQDPRVLRKLRDDAERLEQEYLVEVAGQLSPEQLSRLQHGLVFEGRPLPPAKVSWQSERRLRFAVKNPRPGQIRYACEAVGLQVLAMKRIRIGRLPLARLPVGRWRYLAPGERF